jgi:hypothetical protein
MAWKNVLSFRTSSTAWASERRIIWTQQRGEHSSLSML